MGIDMGGYQPYSKHRPVGPAHSHERLQILAKSYLVAKIYPEGNEEEGRPELSSVLQNCTVQPNTSTSAWAPGT